MRDKLNKKSINIGILGTGFMGRTHAYAYKNIGFYLESPQVMPELVGIYGRNPEKTAKFKNIYGFRKEFLNNWQKLVEDKEIEVIDNCLPNFMHYEPCLYALEKNKHVICEKPLTVRLEEAKTLYERMLKTGVKTMTVFNYRFLPAVMFMKKFIEAGNVGRIFHFRGLFAHSGHIDVERRWGWKEHFDSSGGGASADLGIHVIDLARFLVGNVTKVYALEKTFIPERKDQYGEVRKVTVDDAFVSLITFENGATGIIEATRVGTGFKNYLRIEIHGSEGALAWNLEDLNYVKVFRAEGPREERGWKRILIDLPWWPPRGHIGGWQIGHVFALYNFLKAVIEDEAFSPSFYDGYQAQRVLEAIHISSREHQEINLEAIK